MYIEFIGPPGSGKTFFFKKLSKFLRKKKIDFETPRNVFINYYVRKKSNDYKIGKYLFKYYFKYINPYSKFLFKKETQNLKLFIEREINTSKRIKAILMNYKNFLKDVILPKSLVERMLLNFKIDCIGIMKSKNKLLIAEEGIYQKFFLNFKSKKKKINRFNLVEVFKNLKNPNIIFHFNYDIKDSIARSKKRNKGFKYFIRRKFILNDKEFFNDYLIDFLEKKKINIFKVYSNKKINIELNESFARRLF